MDENEIIAQAQENFGPFIFALIVLIAGYFLAKVLSIGVKKGLARAKVEKTVVHFLGLSTFILILVCTFIAALGQAGVETTSLLAVLGAAGLAIGLSLQGTLSNLAAGILLIVLRPYKAGEYVEIGGEMGTVDSLELFHSMIITPDNKLISMPNSKVLGTHISNFHRLKKRRIDLTYMISYKDDLAKAKQVLSEILESHPLVLKAPSPAVAVGSLRENGVELVARPWAKATDVIGVGWDINEQVLLKFQENGIEIPIPQRKIHQAVRD